MTVETCSFCGKKKMTVCFFAASGGKFIVVAACVDCLKLVKRGYVSEASGEEISQILKMTSGMNWVEKMFSWTKDAIKLSKVDKEETTL